MRIIVCIKQVPDAKDVRLDPKTNTMARDGVESIMNPFDRHAVEEAVRKALDDPELELMATTLPDERKGEQIVLLTVADINRSDLSHKMIQGDCSSLMIPAVVYQVEQLPVLGSGKADFKQAREVAAELAG